MKKVVNVGIGGTSFIIDEDAYHKLDQYLEKFRQRTNMGVLARDVMEDLEQRIAELFSEALKSKQEVVNISLVSRVITQLGMPDGEYEEDTNQTINGGINMESEYKSAVKRLYRDSDNKTIGGVCSGLALYLNVDVVLVKIIFLVAFFMGGVGFWAYIIFWIVAPLAVTAVQKCEMRGLPVTAENIRRFSNSK